MAEKTTGTTEGKSYTKRQFAEAKRYARYRDVVTALLDEEKMYTFAEVDKEIEAYRKGRVKA